MSKNRKLKKKMKNMAATVGTLLLIVGVSIGITLALLSAKTNKKENTFSGSKGVQGSTYEEKWDDSSPTSPEPGATPSGDYYGINESNPYTPGMIINKNPKVANLSTDQNVWVMMRVEYTIEGKNDTDTASKMRPVTYSEFAKLARVYTGESKDVSTGSLTSTVSGVDAVEGINSNWVIYTTNSTKDTVTTENVLKTSSSDTDTTKNIDNAFLNYYSTTTGKGEEHIYYYYYYKTQLKPSDTAKTDDADKYPSTTALFDTVHINTQAADYDNIFFTKESGDPTYSFASGSTTYYTYSSLPNFSINVESAIIAADTLKDPTDLSTAATTDKTDPATILKNLKDVFDAYDSKN